MVVVVEMLFFVTFFPFSIANVYKRERERDRDRDRDRQTDRQRERERNRERERENSKSKTLFYKDCSLGSVKNLTTVLAKLLMTRYQITGIIYIQIGMNE